MRKDVTGSSRLKPSAFHKLIVKVGLWCIGKLWHYKCKVQIFMGCCTCSQMNPEKANISNPNSFSPVIQMRVLSVTDMADRVISVTRGSCERGQTFSAAKMIKKICLNKTLLVCIQLYLCFYYSILSIIKVL